MMHDLSGKKIGILGGSFDPIHNGHLAIAKAACQDFCLDGVFFIPAGHSPNKNEDQMTPPDLRAEMVQLAIEPFPDFYLTDDTIGFRQIYMLYSNIQIRAVTIVAGYLELATLLL